MNTRALRRPSPALLRRAEDEVAAVMARADEARDLGRVEELQHEADALHAAGRVTTEHLADLVLHLDAAWRRLSPAREP